MNIRNAATIRINYDDMALFDDRYARKIASKKTTPPTEQQWAEYRHARALLDQLTESPYFQDGGPDEGATVTEPQPRTEYTYAETEQEWSERCANITGPNPTPGPWGTLRPFTSTHDAVLAEYYDVLRDYTADLVTKYLGTWQPQAFTLTVPNIGEITGHYQPRTEAELFTARLKAPKWPPIASVINPRNEVAR